MKALNFLAAICIVCVLASCGDSTCDVADWTGTWNLDTDSVADCDDPEFAESFTIAPGSEAGTISIDGTEVTLDIESCMFAFDGADVELDGDEIKVDFEGCIATYK